MKRLCVIAETDPFIARLLQRFAEESGLETLPVQIGPDVLALAQEKNPAVIILDPELPGKLRGWELLHLLHEDAQTGHIPVITCTWMDAVSLQARAGMVSVSLKKPEIHYDDFVDALKQAGIDKVQP